MYLRSKPVGTITKEDLDSLVLNQVPESITLDYKQELPGSSDGARKEFLQDVSALANSSGGVIIYGIEELREDGHSTGVPSSIKGVGNVNKDENTRRLESMLQDGLTPRIRQPRFQYLDTTDGVVLLLGIAKSLLTPHIVWFQRDGRCWGRNSGGKFQMDVEQLRQAFLETEELSLEARRFHDDRVSYLRTKHHRVPANGAAYILHLVPLGQGRRIIDLVPHHALLQLTIPPPMAPGGFNYRQNFDGCLTFFEQEDFRGHIQYFRNGYIEVFHNRFGWRDNENNLHLPGADFEDKTEEFVRRLSSEIWPKIGVEPPFAVVLAILGVANGRIEGTQVQNLLQKYRIEQSDLFLHEVIIEDLEAPISEALRPLFDIFWQSGGWTKSPYFDKDGRWSLR